MNPEEYLDRLIERRERGETQLPVTNDEVAASLAAAEILTQLQEIEVPPEFASRLELSIRARARGLAQQNGRTVPTERPQSPVSSHRSPRRRAWIVELGAAAVLMLVYIGMVMTYARNLPGASHYGSKQAEQQITRTVAGDLQDRASIQIDQLRSSIVDLSTVVNDGRDDNAIKLALDIVAGKTSDSRSAVAVLPAGTGREATQRDLDGVLAMEEQTLRHLLDHVDWPIRLAFTRQLGALGDAVPTVTYVKVLTRDNGTLLITLTGTHFAPHAELIIDGRPGGTVSQSTPEQLVAVISNSTWPPGVQALGVRNPDGTAAQIVLNRDNTNYYERNSHHSRHDGPNDHSDEQSGQHENLGNILIVVKMPDTSPVTSPISYRQH